MRKDPFSVGSYVHVYNRGTRKMSIVRDESDKWRFLKLVRYLNDENVPRNWERDVGPDHMRKGFERPDHWPQRDPYVSILAYCLMDNHFHFLFRETKEGGISKFMQRLGTSMSSYFNAKYEEGGTLFEGSYQARTIGTDTQLQYLAAYIHVKNPFERYPKGYGQAAREFDRAFEWALHDPFCGLGFEERSAILDVRAIGEVMRTKSQFRSFARDVIHGRRNIDIQLLIDS